MAALVCSGCSSRVPSRTPSNTAIPAERPNALLDEGKPVKPEVPATPFRDFKPLATLPEGRLILTTGDRGDRMAAMAGSQVTQQQALADSANFSGDRRFLAYGTYGVSCKLTLQRLDGQPLDAPPGFDNACWSLWCPKGATIAYGRDATMVIVNLDASTRSQYEIPSSSSGVVWAADGDALILRAAGDTIKHYLVSLSTRTVQELPGDIGLRGVAISPNGRYVGYATGKYSAWYLTLFDANTGAPCTVVPTVPVSYRSTVQPEFIPLWSSDSRYVSYGASHLADYGYTNAHIADPVTCSDAAVFDPVKSCWRPVHRCRTIVPYGWPLGTAAPL